MNAKRTGILMLTIAFVASSANIVMCQVTAEVQPTAKLPKLSVGDPLPAFESIDEAGHRWKSSEIVGKCVVVFYFYPGDFTGGCIKQAEAYRDGLAAIESNCVLVVGVSGDEVATHKLFHETFGLKHPLLADSKGELANLLGIPFTNGGRHVSAIAPDRKLLLDANGERIVLNRPVTLARWTVVVDREGRVASMREVKNPVSDIEEVMKIVDRIPK